MGLWPDGDSGSGSGVMNNEGWLLECGMTISSWGDYCSMGTNPYRPHGRQLRHGQTQLFGWFLPVVEGRAIGPTPTSTIPTPRCPSATQAIYSPSSFNQ